MHEKPMPLIEVRMTMAWDEVVLSVAQMGQADAWAVTAGVSGVELMDRAGRGMADAITSRWARRPVVVIHGLDDGLVPPAFSSAPYVEAARAAMELKCPHRVILGTDGPAGSGVQPLGMLRMVALLSSLAKHEHRNAVEAYGHQNLGFAEKELRKFADLAARWWDTQGPMRPLHDINPVRLDWIDRLAPLAGRRVLDER